MSNQVQDQSNQAQNNQPLLYPQFEQTTSQIVYPQQRPPSGIVPSTFPNNSQQMHMIRPSSADGYKCPIILICPYCRQEGVTNTEYRIGNGTLICTFIICILFTILFFIPLIMNQCKDVYHKCPYCNQIVGHTKYSPCG